LRRRRRRQRRRRRRGGRRRHSPHAVPTVTSETVPLAVGALGALVMSHNVFLYSQLMAGHRAVVEATGARCAARIVSAEAALALALTFAVNVAAVCVFARGFEAARGAGRLGLAGAGDALAALKRQQPAAGGRRRARGREGAGGTGLERIERWHTASI